MAMSAVRGEITGFRGAHSSGHCYFSLKDKGAKIEAVISEIRPCRMRFKPQEGLEVIATGKLTTYPGSSKYQIVIEALEPAGIGALMALMEERKKKLAAGAVRRGAQAAAAWLPEVIGVVTSPTGAVIRDILHRLQDRFPAGCWCGRSGSRARVPPNRSQPRSAASTRCRKAAGSHGPIS